MAWTQYTEMLDVLNASDFNNLLYNAIHIRDEMFVKDINVGTLKTKTASMNTRLKDVKQLLNNMEYNLDVLNSALPSEFYGQPVRYEEIAPNKLQVWRWIQILNDLYSKVFDETNHKILQCSNGYPVINGQKIAII